MEKTVNSKVMISAVIPRNLHTLAIKVAKKKGVSLTSLLINGLTVQVNESLAALDQLEKVSEQLAS